MAKVDISKYTEALSEFMENAERFKVTKADLEDNLPQLRDAIAIFERLSELQKGLDPNSPRAKNYFNLMQSIASINSGWHYNQAQIKREAQLADSEKAQDRLTSEETATLYRLMGSSHLKNFVQFLDAENLEAFQNLKYIVQAVDKHEPRKEEDNSDTAMARRWTELYEYIVETARVEPDWVKEMDKKVSTSETKPAEKEESASKEDQEKEQESTEATLNLNQFEKTRQAEVRQAEVVAEIKNTSGAIQEALSKKQQKSEIKVTSKQRKPKKVSSGSFMDDLKTFLKWTIGAGAAIAGIAWIADDIVKYLKGLVEETEETRESVQKFIDDRNSSKEEDRKVWADPEKAAQQYQKNLEYSRFTAPTQIGSLKITPEQINTLHTLYAEGRDAWRDRSAQVLTNMFGSTPTDLETAAIEAILRGENVVAVTPESGWVRTKSEEGMGRIYNIDAIVGTDEDQDPVALQTRAIHGARNAFSYAPFYRPQIDLDAGKSRMESSAKDDLSWTPDWVSSSGAWVVGQSYLAAHKLRRVLSSDTKRGFSEEQLKSMTVAEREQAILQEADKILKRWEKRGNIISSSGISEGVQSIPVGEPTLELFNIGEVIKSSTKGRYEGLRKAQASGNPEWVAAEISKFTKKPVSADHPMVREALHYDDYGVDDVSKFQEFLERNNSNYIPQVQLPPRDNPQVSAPSQTTVSQTVTTTFNTDYSNQQAPGEL